MIELQWGLIYNIDEVILEIELQWGLSYNGN